MTHRKTRRTPARQRLPQESFHLAEEVRSIQQRAAEHDGRMVSIGPLVLFSTKTGDAWILDPVDQLAARLASNGDPLPLYIEETNTNYAIGWQGATGSTQTPSSMKTTNRGASLQSAVIQYSYSFA